MTSHPFRLYAHRGAAAELPENTLEAFARALELGADAIETDVHATRDGVLVVAHDPDGRRLAGVGASLAQSDWAQVRTWDAGFGFRGPDGSRPFAGSGFRLASFEEVLDSFPGAVLNVDLKAPCADSAVQLLRRLRAQERVCLASFQLGTLRRVRALGYEGATSLAAAEVVRLVGLPATLLRGPLGFDAVAAQLPVRLGRSWLIRRCHALGLRVDFWTVNDAAEARRLVDLGADGVMTDDPGRIGPVVRRAREQRRQSVGSDSPLS